jgi:hypothetical protein
MASGRWRSQSISSSRSGAAGSVEGVVPVSGTDAAGHRQQVQVMVAQDRPGTVAHVHDRAQGLQGLGPRLMRSPAKMTCPQDHRSFE